MATLRHHPERSCSPPRCQAYTPCLVEDPAVRARLPPSVVCAGFDADHVRAVMMASFGKPAHRCLQDEALARHGTARLEMLRRERSTLRITGPVNDGFWVRVLVVLAHGSWALRLGLPMSIAYRSSHDAYMDARDAQHDGWSRYFEPLASNASLSSASSPPPLLVQLDCAAAARVWEGYANYAPTYSAAILQRRHRIQLIRRLAIQPRRSFRRAASQFWHRHGLGGPNGTLGLHLRGTDKPGAHAHTGPPAFLPLLRAYLLCHKPHSALFVATDDSRMLSELLAALDRLNVPRSRVVWRAEAVRSNTTFNPGFHAQELDLTGQGESLGEDVLLDTLLLSKVDFLLKSKSSVSEFAIYWSESNGHLQGDSYDVQLKGQPKPSWANACST